MNFKLDVPAGQRGRMWQSYPATASTSGEIATHDLFGRTLNFILLMIYYHALGVMYVEYIQPIWEGLGLKLIYNPILHIPALLLLLLCTLFLPSKFQKVSDIFLCGLLLFTITPTCVLFVHGGLSIDLVASTVLVHCTIYCVRFFNIRIPKSPKIDLNRMLAVLIVLNVAMLGYLVVRIGTSSFSLDFLDVYDRREVASDGLSLTIDGYISQICTQLNLIASILALHYRKKIQFSILILIAILLFGFLGHKAQIILPFALIFINILINNKYIVHIILVSMVSFSAFIAYYYINTDDPLVLISLTFRRMMFIPVALNQAYFDYAQNNGYIYWADSKFGLGLVQYRDTVSTSNAIGEIVTGNIKTHANTGMIGSGYLHAGFIGIAVYTLLLSILVNIIDNIARAKNLTAISTLICLPPLLTAVISSDLPALVLSGGLGLSIIILFLLPSEALLHRR